MTTAEILTWLRNQGVRLWMDGEQLRYSAPADLLTTEMRKLLGQRKDEILDFLRNAKKSILAVQTSICPIPRDDGERLRLSYAQERLWFLNQLQPESAGYNVPGVIKLTGSLRLEVLERVINEVVKRHEVLRTTFEEDGEKGPVQVIHEARWQALLVVDLSGLEEPERQKTVRELIAEEGRRGFDLSVGPVVRVEVLRLGGQEHVILYTLHHIVSDGWSTGVLNRETGLLYEAFSKGKPSPLPKLPVQYADYAVWQRGWLEGEVLERQMKYWKGQLAGINPLELATDRVRPVVRSFKGGIKRLRIGREVAGALKQLSQREGVTLFMTLLGGLQVMLSRYSGQEGIAVGAPIANRNRAEIEGLIGFFVNTLVLRTDLSGDPTVSELLGRVRQVTLGAYEHQDLPFEKVVEELQPERDLSRNPFTEVSLELQNVPDEGVELGGLKLEPMEGREMTTRWDLELHFRETVEGLSGWMVYDRELFEEGSMERMGMHLERVLEGMGALGGGVRISGLKLMEPSEEAEMVEGWNRTEMEYEREKCAHELFEEQVRTRGEAVAVECGQEAVSFGELNERAQRVAWRLRQLGVGPEVLVGVCLERSVEMVAGLLGVWKAGGAYVPLDPANPVERLAYIMEDAGITVLVTSRALEEKLPMNGSIVVYVEEAVGGEGLEEAELWGWSSGVGAWNLAYVMYTSGSTGRPKGVMVAHRGLVNYLSWSVRAYGMEGGGQGLGSAVHSSIGFDLTVTSLYTPLVGGRRVRMIREQEGVGGVEEVMKGKGYGLLKVTPGHLEVMRGLGKELGGLAGAMVIGGEALKGTAIREWQRQAEGTRLINEYGPTETVVGCCVYEVKGSQEIVGAVPIGRPIGNTRIYVMGRHYEVQAVGLAGEIWIGGDGVARGYWNRSELTAEKFVPDPYGKSGGERMYRSGDVGRYMADGTLEYMGRQDQQVKVRGYRIELGEIEKVLSGHAEVRQSVVVVREDGNGERKLVGYVVANEKGGNGSEGRQLLEELRKHLKQKLPDYMVPGALVRMEHLPLTANGKVDRRALPEPERSREEKGSRYVEPRTLVEKKLVGIWRALLGLERVGVEDDFFDLGGHSLLATQAVTRIREVLKVDLPLRTLFELPTIAEIGGKVEELTSRGINCVAEPLQKAPRQAFMPTSYAQERLWFIDQLQPGSTGYNVPVAARVTGPLDVGILARVIGEIVRRHEVLRTTFEDGEKGPVQVIHEARWQALPVVDLSGLEEPQRQKVARELTGEEGRRAFDLRAGPVVRVGVLRLGEQEHVILYTLHHIASDGWSMGVLNREVSLLYKALSLGEELPLEELPVQYADYAVWQRGWLEGEVLERQMKYWKGQLAGISPLELPTDRVRPVVQNFKGGVKWLRIEREVAGALKQLSQREGVTLFMTLLGGLQVMLSRYSGQEDIAVGAPIANRNWAEIEGLIGFFVNTLVLRTDLSGNPTVSELLGRVREVTLGAYEHQDLPFEKLVEELQPERDLSFNPLFGVILELQNAPDEGLELEGIRLEGMEGRETTTRFDLEFHFWEQEEQLRGTVNYNRDLFEAETVQRMIGHLERVLVEFVGHPGRRIGELSLLTETERAEMMRSKSWREYRADKSIHGTFEEQVGRGPEATAVVCGEERLSYGQLNSRANKLARRLRREGVGPEVKVGLCVERSLELVVGMLGILKAGGAYVPLDRANPQERLGYIIEDAQPALVLSDGEGGDGLEDSGVKVMRLDLGWEEMEGEEGGNPGWESDPDNLAYVIYTSGSTGRPKGALVTHRNVVRLFEATEEKFGFGRQDVWTLFHSHAFDFSVWEIWGALLYGGRLVVVPYLVSRSPESFYELLEKESVTVLNQTPSAFWSLAGVEKVMEGEGKLALRVVVFGGEALNVGGLRGWWERHGTERPQMVNMYGITETTVHVTYEALGWEHLEGGSWIGRELADLRVYLLDGHGQPVPAGVLGEIHVGGGGLARGYHRRADLTAERFVPDPYGTAGSRMYRSGDLGRCRSNGALEYLGRADQQVKVRGYRIELGEIENVLSRHAEVRQSVVVVREDGNGERKLVGYVVGRGAQEGESQREQVGEWKEVFNEHLYDGAGGGGTRNFTGWNSSYTGQPIEVEQMNEWLEGTVSAIRALKPGRILEIGSGSGLVLFEVAPWCTEYWGTDFSGRSLEYVRRQLSRQGLGNGRVKLLEREADNFEGMEGEGFDGVVINSVAQYFPDMEYLVRVLDGAVGVVKEGGFIYVGDVRSKELWGVFHGTVEVARAGEGVSVRQLRQRIEAGQRQEKELLVEAGFFEAYGAQQERIKGVRIGPKRGKYRNELSMFRYEVMLTVGVRQEGLGPQGVKKWAGGQRAEEAVREMAERGWESFVIEEVGNGRLDQALELERLIWEGSEERRVREIRRQAQEVKEEGIDPEEWYEAGERMGYEVELSWARGGRQGGYDVEMWKGQRPARQRGEVELRPWREYGTEPLRGRAWRRLGGELKRHAAERLPQYMVPAVIVVLEEMPLTGNGKVDRGKLPEPVMDRVASGRVVEARTEVERRLERIWSEVLGVGRVSMEDNFFELGGHSLLATQVASRIRESFQVELPLRLLFENPTIASLSKKIEELQQQGTDSQIPLLMAVARNGRLPLSHAQERLWFIHQLEAESTAYNMPSVRRMVGALRLDVLERVVNEIVRRHETLRTTFELTNDGSIQAIHAPTWIHLPVIDISGLEGANRRQEAIVLTRQEASLPFDLQRGPVFRVSVLRLDPGDHVILHTIHHIASDGWSIGVLNREIGILYQAFVRGEQPRLPELRLQYADYATWQRSWLRGEALERQSSYWKDQLKGITPLQLPMDRTRPTVQSYRGGEEAVYISEELTTALKGLSHQQSLTLFMILLGGLQILLSRHSGQEDVAIAIPVANRTCAEVEPLIGFFVNQLVIRSDLSGDPTVVELLARVRDVTLGAYTHQDLPFEKLVEELQPERDLSRSPVVQVAFALQNAPDDGVQLEGIEVRSMEGVPVTTRLDLELHLWERGNLAGSLIYNIDLFDAARMRRMARQWERLLGAMAANPRQRISEFPLLAPSEREQILTVWNNTAVDLPHGSWVVHMFEGQAARTPDALALTCAEKGLSYRDLNRRVSQLARYLQARGVGPEVFVGLCVDRSLEMLVGIWGILKAGGAYVPLDPDYPKERLAFMAKDAGLKIVLTHSACSHVLKDQKVLLICLDTELEAIEEQDWGNPAVPVVAGNAAYLIYTSGSTGEPRGVIVTHQNLANSTRVRMRYHRQPMTGFLLLFSIAFDGSVVGVFWTLCQGGTLVLPAPGDQRDPRRVSELIFKKRISHVNCLASFYELCLAEDSFKACASINTVILGGESCPNHLFAKHSRLLPYADLFNEYGPTEGTVWATVCRLEPGHKVPFIGKPIGNARVYILNRNGDPQPAGLTGEIYIGGGGVTRGYLNRADLTAEKFVPDSFGREKGERLYRTGDLARYSDDGNIEFLGRLDEQVKVRGYRIELGEVENAIASHPGVQQVAVIVREDEPGNKRLVGYVVAQEFEQAEAVEAEAVQAWHKVFDDHVHKPVAVADPVFNFAGWKSSYSGEAIPADEMRQWLEDVADAVKALKPRRVLEIGCGNGLVLFQVAPTCEEYWGTDFSRRALEYVTGQLDTQGLGCGRVKLLERKADDFGGFRSEKFDAVILNSVAQYFPDVEYLVKVLEQSVSVIKSGGFIYLGDIRSLPLDDVFQASVQVDRVADETTAAQIRERVQLQRLQEPELLLDPCFFLAIKERLAGIARVEILPKRGESKNELTLFRYQVILHVGEAVELGPAAKQLEWKKGDALDVVRELLVREEPESLEILNVANGRLDEALEIACLVWSGQDRITAGEIKQRVKRHERQGQNPGNWHNLGQRLGYHVELNWAGHDHEGRYDVLMWRKRRRQFSRKEAESFGPLNKYANIPKYGRLARRLTSALKKHVEEKLPRYMVPSAFVPLLRLPVTVNGKLDRNRLPMPHAERNNAAYLAPRTDIERKLERIWSEVLSVERVSVDGNFFEVGGHSVLAMQVVSRVRKHFGVELPLRVAFEAPTIIGVAEEVALLQAARARSEQDELLRMLEGLDDDEVQAELSKRLVGPKEKDF